MTRKQPPSSPNGTPQRRRVDRSVPDRDAWAWADKNRGRPVIAPPPAAGRAASRLIKPLAQRFGPGASELEAQWPEIVGEALANYSTPVKFQSGTNGLTLVINARGPAASLLEAQSTQILDRVTRFTGKAAKKLKLTQGAIVKPRTPPKSRPERVKKVAQHKNEAHGLAEVMEAFESAVFNHHTKRQTRTPDSSEE